MNGGAPELLPPRREEGYDAAGKSPEAIEADIALTRGELAAILDTIERRLAPRHLMERGIDMVKDTMSGEGGGFGDMLLSHPVPLALIGMGVGWLMMSSTARSRPFGGGADERDGEAGPPPHYPTEEAGYAYARQKSGDALAEAQGAAAEAQHGIEETLERGREAGRAAWQQTKSYAEDTGERLHRAGDRVGALMQDHPLALGALGLLAGAVVALLLPRSPVEERIVGPAGEELRERAAEFGREAAERARHVAQRTVNAAVDAARDEVGQATGGPRSEPGPSVG